MKVILYTIMLFVLNASVFYGTGSCQGERNRNRQGQKQVINLSGTVTDKETGETIFGAAVYVKGTKMGTITDKDGRWKLADIPGRECVIVVAMAGYKAVEKKTSGGNVDVQLEVSLFNAGEVVITGTQTKHIYQDAPVKTEVMPKRQIEALNEADLYGVLQYTPGVRIENDCQNCSFTQLRMLGLEGGYSQILINGDPIVSTMAGVYGLQQFPEQMIESLEVVKGGGSALYGANAIGGVVNIRLRQPMLNKTSATFDYKVADDHVRSEAGFYSEMVSNDTDFGMVLFGNARKQNPYDRDDDGYSDIGMLDGETIGLNMVYKLSPKSNVTGHLHHIYENRRGGDNLSKPSHQANVSEAAESQRWGGNFKYSSTVNERLSFEAGYSFALAGRETYYGAGMDPNAYGTTDNPVHYLSGMAHYQAGKHTITGGMSHLSEKLIDKAVSYNRVIDESYKDTGFFIQDDFSIADRFTIVAGARADNHSLLNDFIFSPRLSAMMKLFGGWKLRGSISTGFKPPQVFDEDLHITQVNGQGQLILNDPGLEEEKSMSLSGTLDYMGSYYTFPVQFGTTVFRTNLRDQFQTIEADNPLTSYTEFQRRNGDGLTVSGIEFQAGIMPVRKLELQGSFTVQTDKLDSPEPDFGSHRLFRTPENYGNIFTIYDVHERLSLTAGVNYTGSMYAPHYAGYILEDKLEKTDPFITLDLGMTIELTHHSKGNGEAKLKLGVKNITDSYQEDLDKGPDRDAGYMYGPATPRMVYAGIEFGI